jgi:hypothetical protein
MTEKHPVLAAFIVIALSAIAWLAVWLSPVDAAKPVDHLTPIS